MFGIPLRDEEADTVSELMAKLLNVVPIPSFSVTYRGTEMMTDRTMEYRHQIGTVLMCLAPETSREEKKEASDWPAVPLRFRLLHRTAQREKIHLDQRLDGSEGRDRLLKTPDHQTRGAGRSHL